jgi:hypothetical protein
LCYQVLFNLIANGDGDATPVKKKKVEEVSLAFRWEYEGDKRTWTQYSSAIDSSLTDAYNTKKKQVQNEAMFQRCLL